MTYHTEQQALRHYAEVYDNDAYSAVTDELVWVLSAGSDLSTEAIKNTPDYYALSNLLTNVALEICGHPSYNGEGWTLSTSLNAVTAPRLQAGHLNHDTVQKLLHLIDGYLGIYRAYMVQIHNTFHTNRRAKATTQLDSAWTLAGEAVRASSDVPNWQGRGAYHLVSAAEGLLRTAMLVLAMPEQPSPAQFGYAAEKYGRAFRDLRFAMTEIEPHSVGTSLYAAARHALRDLSEEV